MTYMVEISHCESHAPVHQYISGSSNFTTADRLTTKKLGPQKSRKGLRVKRNAKKHPDPCKKKPSPWVPMCLAVT